MPVTELSAELVLGVFSGRWDIAQLYVIWSLHNHRGIDSSTLLRAVYSCMDLILIRPVLIEGFRYFSCVIFLNYFLVIVIATFGHQSLKVDVRLPAVHVVHASLLCSSDCLDVLFSCLLELSE